MKVSEVMRQSVIVIREDTSLEEAACLMLKHTLRGLPVVDKEGKICGFISVSDFTAKEGYFVLARVHAPQLFGSWLPSKGIERIYQRARTRLVKEVMSREVITVTEDDPIEKVVDLMLYRELNRIPVVRDNVPVGIIARHDLLKLVSDKKALANCD